MGNEKLGDAGIGTTHSVEPVVVVSEGSGKTANIEGAKAKEVHNAELFAALQESKIHAWSNESRTLYLAIFTAFLCACANGYDGEAPFHRP